MLFIGERLRELRKKNNMTLQALADEIFVTKVSICGYEKQTRTPSLEIAKKLADKFEVSVDYFLGRDLVLKEEEIVLSRDDIRMINEIKAKPEVYKFLQNERNIKLLLNKIRRRNGTNN